MLQKITQFQPAWPSSTTMCDPESVLGTRESDNAIIELADSVARVRVKRVEAKAECEPNLVSQVHMQKQ